MKYWFKMNRYILINGQDTFAIVKVRGLKMDPNFADVATVAGTSPKNIRRYGVVHQNDVILEVPAEVVDALKPDYDMKNFKNDYPELFLGIAG